MRRNEADAVVTALNAIFTDRPMVTVRSRPPWYEPSVLTDQDFEKAYVVEYTSGKCSVGVCDTYGTMTGAEEWSLDIDERKVTGKTTNGCGDDLWFCYVVQNSEDDLRETFNRHRKLVREARILDRSFAEAAA